MNDKVTVQTMIRRIREGDSQIVTDLWKRYFHRLEGLARKRLLGAYKAEADEEDVALSALKSFCLRAQRGDYPLLEGEEELWNLLATITRNKAQKLRDRHDAKKRDWRRARSSSEEEDEERVLSQFATTEPDPARLAESTECVSHLMEMLDNDQQREVALCKLAGWTNLEAADLLQCAVSTIERRLRFIREQWQEVLDQSAE